MSTEKELAYRYDLLITPEWRDRFDSLVDEKVVLPAEGLFLDLNCGTGAYTLELAGRLRGKGDVVGLDPSEERIELARAKIAVLHLQNVSFDVGGAQGLPFEEGEFGAVIGDASMLPAGEIEGLLTEMIRVAKPDGRIVIKMATHGAFDEFFSIYWEALLDCGVVDHTWTALERIIEERLTVSDAEDMAARLGLRGVASFTNKEEFSSDGSKQFLESPIIGDIFLDDWLAIVPEDRRGEIKSRISDIIDRERHGAAFEFSIKATVLTGLK
jgi:ubiquinone/menaquinone biosynthesis C-methylase UbiE